MSLAAGTYALDPAHTVIGFVAKHAMVTKVRGNFADFEGTITVAENIAYGYDNFDKTLGQWINSPGHRKNLLLPKATKVGIASARNASGKRTYWAMVIAGDYESDRPKPAPKSRGKAVVAQTAPKAEKSETKPVTRWGAKPPASKDCHLNIKVIGLCI